MSAGKQPSPQPRRRSRRRLAAALAALLAAAGIAVAVDRKGTTRDCAPARAPTSRPELQRVLDRVVAGRAPLAPGATAYVSGPHGTWAGAAGVADASTCAPMRADARMRLESVTKIYTATLILQLAQEGRLRLTDTVDRWLPGLLRRSGRRITIRRLLTMTSGLVDDNDYAGLSFDDFDRTALARVGDPAVRKGIRDFVARGNRDPSAELSEMWWVRLAAWQPLLFEPGTDSHYSNIGYDVLGLIAARAGGRPLAALFGDRIFTPLGLHATAYDPQGRIAGPHAHGYAIGHGSRTDASDWHWGRGAEGGIVSNAGETAAFLAALMRGGLLRRDAVTAMQGGDLFRGGASSCTGAAYGWSGGGSGYKTDVWVNGDGTRVAVVLLNARHTGDAQPQTDQAAHDALAALYCAA